MRSSIELAWLREVPGREIGRISGAPTETDLGAKCGGMGEALRLGEAPGTGESLGGGARCPLAIGGAGLLDIGGGTVPELDRLGGADPRGGGGGVAAAGVALPGSLPFTHLPSSLS